MTSVIVTSTTLSPSSFQLKAIAAFADGSSKDVTTASHWESMNPPIAIVSLTGLVTGVDLSYYTQRNVGPIALIAQTTPDKAKAAIKALYEEVAHFNDKDYYTDEQLESAKALLEADDLYSREKLSDYTHTLSFWWASTGLEYFRGYLPRLRNTSRADIGRYITTYIQGKPHIGLALMSNEAQARIKIQPEELVGPQ